MNYLIDEFRFKNFKEQCLHSNQQVVEQLAVVCKCLPTTCKK